MSRGRRVLSSSLINAAAGLFSLAAGFGASLIVARLLGVEGSGVVAFALWIMTAATLVSDFGMPQTALRFIAGNVEPGSSRSSLFAALTKRFVLPTTLATLGMLGYALLVYMEGDSGSALIWAATAMLFVSYAYSTMSLGAAHGLGQFRDAAERTLMGSLIQPVAILAGALLLGPAGAIFGYATRHLPQALALRRYLPKGQSRDALITPPMKQYARHNWLSGCTSSILGSRVELAIIGLYFSFVDVGYYAVGVTMSGLVLQLGMFFVAALVPYFGALHDLNDMAGLTRGYQGGMRWLAIALAPICFGGAAIAPVLIPSLFGAQFEPGVGSAEVLLASTFPVALAAVSARMLLARERSLDVLKLSLVLDAASMLLMLSIIPYFGGLGAAWVKGAVGVLELLTFLWFCQKRLDIPTIPMDIVKIVAAGVLAGVAARVCILWIPGLGGMALGIAAGAVVYPACILLFRALSADDKALLSAWASTYGPARLRQWLPMRDAALERR